MCKKVMIIAAHPDDELLGCGGTISMHTLNGDIVQPIIVCEGETMRNQSIGEKISCSKNASKILKTLPPIFLNFPDQRLDTFSLVDIICPLERIINDFQPNIVYIHYNGDLNKDHKIVFEASMVALRPNKKYIECIYSFYTVSSSEWGFAGLFTPDTWVEISEEAMRMKNKAFQCYYTENCTYPHPRSVQGLDSFSHFFGNQCCMDYAEPFRTIRKVLRINNV